MEELDEQAREQLRSYQAAKHECHCILAQAAGSKQRALGIGRQLADLGERYGELRAKYIGLFSRLHQDSPAELIQQFETIRQRMRDTRELLRAWSCRELQSDKKEETDVPW